MGHEYAGVVEQVGDSAQNVKPGDFAVGSFFASDNTCEICRAGYQSRCVHAAAMGAIGTQAQFARIPLADGTLVATPGRPEPDLIPSLLAASDVLGTGWFAAVAVEAGPGKTVAIKELTNGLGAHSVIEAVGSQESMTQAICSTRPGGHVSFVGVTLTLALTVFAARHVIIAVTSSFAVLLAARFLTALATGAFWAVASAAATIAAGTSCELACAGHRPRRRHARERPGRADRPVRRAGRRMARSLLGPRGPRHEHYRHRQQARAEGPGRPQSLA